MPMGLYKVAGGIKSFVEVDAAIPTFFDRFSPEQALVLLGDHISNDGFAGFEIVPHFFADLIDALPFFEHGSRLDYPGGVFEPRGLQLAFFPINHDIVRIQPNFSVFKPSLFVQKNLICGKI